MQTSGLVLDVHDDTRGEVLSTIFPTFDSIPEVVKTAAALAPEERDRLPDDAFALVLIDGGQKLRKYACYDAGSTLLSTAYFMKTAGRLPEEARAIAAGNIAEAHEVYGLVPDGFRKTALGVGTAISALSAPAVLQGTHEAVKGNLGAIRALEAPGRVVTPGQIKEYAKMADASGTSLMPLSSTPSGGSKPKAVIKKTANIGVGDVFLGSLAANALVGGVMGHAKGKEHGQAGEAAIRGAAGAVLGGLVGGPAGVLIPGTSGGAHASGTRMTAGMALGGLAGYKALTHKYNKKTAAEHRVEGHHPKHLLPGHKGEYDDTLHNGDGIKGEQPASLPQARQLHFVVTKEQTFCPAEKKASTYALGDKYPLDNLLQIKAAAAYFDEYGGRFTPEDRRAFAVALVKRAAPLRYPLGDAVRQYGSPTYAPLTQIKVAQDLRRVLVEKGSLERDVLDSLFEKRAALSPELFCAALGELDKATGLDAYYDRAIPDSFASTFGMEKRAEFSEVIGNEYVNEDDLRRLARNGAATVKVNFNDEFLGEFQKDPVGIFKSMPREQKILLMRMAGGTAPGEVPQD